MKKIILSICVFLIVNINIFCTIFAEGETQLPLANTIDMPAISVIASPTGELLFINEFSTSDLTAKLYLYNLASGISKQLDVHVSLGGNPFSGMAFSLDGSLCTVYESTTERGLVFDTKSGNLADGFF